MLDVRIGIVSWNTAGLLDACLTAIPSAAEGLDSEVVVVDNASRDGSAQVVRTHSSAQLIESASNLGYARAMNQALAGTEAPVLIALNPDTEPPPGSLTRLVERIQAHPEAGLIVPRLLHPDGTVQHSVYRFPTVALAAAVSFVPPRIQRRGLGRRMWLEGFSPHDTAGEIEWAIGAVHVIRAKAVPAASPYSERWFMYVEDIELCWRLRQAGWTVRLEPDISIPHVGNASGRQAWGRDRTRRYWNATYDFVEVTSGPWAVRRLGAVNAVGAGLHAVVNGCRSMLPSRYRARRREVARDLARVAPVHARAALYGGSRLGDHPPPS